MKFRQLTADEMEFVAGGVGCPPPQTRCPTSYDDRWGPGADESEANLYEGYAADAEEEQAAAEQEQSDPAPPPADPVEPTPDPTPDPAPTYPDDEPTAPDGGHAF